jgi:hypothetical protein
MRRSIRKPTLGSLAPLAPLLVGIAIAVPLMVGAEESTEVGPTSVPETANGASDVDASATPSALDASERDAAPPGQPTNLGVERAPISDWQEAHTIVFTFDPESDRLSEIDLEQLRTAVQSANAIGAVRGAAVAAWSDSSYPESPRAMLPRTERALADRRADAVATELRKLDVAAIDVFNMAEHSSWFSRTFKTADARVKGLPDAAAGRQSAKDLQLEALGNMIREKGGPAKVVVALRTEMTAASPVAH